MRRTDRVEGLLVEQVANVSFNFVAAAVPGEKKREGIIVITVPLYFNQRNNSHHQFSVVKVGQHIGGGQCKRYSINGELAGIREHLQVWIIP